MLLWGRGWYGFEVVLNEGEAWQDGLEGCRQCGMRKTGDPIKVRFEGLCHH